MTATTSTPGRTGPAAVEEKVHAIRSTILTGLTEDDYHATVRVLRQNPFGIPSGTWGGSRIR